MIKSKDNLTMIIHNAMVLAVMTFAIVHTGSLWPLVMLVALVGVKGDKEDGVR